MSCYIIIINFICIAPFIDKMQPKVLCIMASKKQDT